MMNLDFQGQGAQGLVVLAKEKSTNKRYAIKGIPIKDSKDNVDQVILGQVQQEIQMLNQCKGSPYVANLLHKIEGNDYIFLVLTECLGTLSDIIKNTQNQRLNELSAIKYTKDIAEGLYFIHSKKCLVNDLKMDNILIDYNGNAVVSDFGFADNLTQQSGYAFDEYKGNIIFQAPECYDPSKFDIYSEEYKNLGVAVKQKPSQRSEACSLGYLLYTMISGFQANLVFSKHQPLQYNADFQNLAYEKQLRYIIDGLTKFIPRERLKVKEALIVLKGIVSFEFDLESKFIEVMDDAEAQQYIRQFRQDIEYVQGFENKFYPIIKNEKELVQYLNSQIDGQKQKHEAVINELNQQIKEMQKVIDGLLNQQEKQGNQKQNIQPFFSNQQASSQQVFQKQPVQGHQDQIQNQKIEKKSDVQNNQQNQEQIKIDQQASKKPTKQFIYFINLYEETINYLIYDQEQNWQFLFYLEMEILISLIQKMSFYFNQIQKAKQNKANSLFKLSIPIKHYLFGTQKMRSMISNIIIQLSLESTKRKRIKFFKIKNLFIAILAKLFLELEILTQQNNKYYRVRN
ncbi:Serine/Threonine kinase domain protein (macronuclear) [Tetrahymena thermophila SB210]|uniref:Serine/Threonine kinase domain protein n=1 Tax=Tetrahymena thermophila (strain SB210) TaxID=312017 RepID=Q22SS0_TETTS|nr:Serine/Threonine kinase domain protein [Tetrahymena thermophila SB210]EAR88305.2 Serine/Threonine kinase domain protein [Tetrahymena thermophila SB210]|eukprot:XP_001008550.2 Serine/Threonine kinase domain protein [Tetrahymena thermophila SB210]